MRPTGPQQNPEAAWGEEETAHMQEPDLCSNASKFALPTLGRNLKLNYTIVQNLRRGDVKTSLRAAFQAHVKLLGKLTLVEIEFIGRNYITKFSGQQEKP